LKRQGVTAALTKVVVGAEPPFFCGEALEMATRAVYKSENNGSRQAARLIRTRQNAELLTIEKKEEG
jgi:hypothetical protein